MSMPQSKHRLRHQSDARARATRIAVWPCFNIRPVISVLLLTLLTAGLVTLSAKPAIASNEAPFGAKLQSAGSWLQGPGVVNKGGVDVYSNGDTGYDSNDYSAPAVGMKWQCVELTQRLYQAKGWHSGYWYLPDKNNPAYDLYTHASDNKLVAHPNDGSYTPVPGDMIVHNADQYDSSGHVAIVDHISGNTIYAYEQNVASSSDNNGIATYTIGANGKLTRSSITQPILGIVHSPNNPNTNGSSDTDGDGVPDSQDWCKITPGTTTNHGCPNNNIQISGDLNGDGKTDVIAISRSNSDNSPYIYWFQSTSTAGTSSVADPVLLGHLPAPAWNMNNLKWAVGDFNGDGKSDLFVASGDPSTGAVVMYVLLSTGTGLASPALVKQPSLAWQWPLLTF